MDVCGLCGKYFRLGYDGTVDGCDECTGYKRDEDGLLVPDLMEALGEKRAAESKAEDPPTE